MKNFPIFVLLAFSIFSLGYAESYDATMAEWTNLLPAIPETGQSAVFTTKISASYRRMPLSVVFRSHNKTFAVSRKDDGAHGDVKAGDGIFGCVFPAQNEPGYWFCFVAAGASNQPQTFSIPQTFTVSPKNTEYRAIWADLWNQGFLTPEQARQFVQTARQGNFNAVIVQVRKVGDAAYNSRIEPRSSNIKDSSYDPLKYIIDLAHDTSGGKKRLEVHAWVVVYRVHKGSAKSGLPRSPHILGKHPEWASKNLAGELFVENSVCLDPGVPGVTDYNISVFEDIVSRYDVDGINFDYIRYQARGWGYNAIALQRFRKLYNRKDTPNARDPQWLEFQREQVTHFLRKAYIRLTAIKPNLKVSVCTIGWGDIPGGDFTRTDAYAGGVQDWNEWQRLQILDVNFRMGYKNQSNPKHKSQFINWTRFSLGHQYFRLSPIGLGAYLNSTEGTLSQIDYARQNGADGFGYYCYNEPAKNTKPTSSYYQAFAKKAFPVWADVPPLAWKESNPNGSLAGIVRRGGHPLDGAIVSLPEIKMSAKTDGTGFYAFIGVPTGKYKIAVNGKTVGTREIHASRISYFDIKY